MAAVAFLARRDYACGELAGKLRERGFEPAVVSALVADLAARRLLDDARYAGHFVEYHRARGQGPVRIRRDLEAFAVAGALIDAALAAVPDWSAVAREVRRRRFGAVVPTDWAEKGRQARFLQYRGFSNDHIRSALGPDLELDS
jgi:regulatory protein